MLARHTPFSVLVVEDEWLVRSDIVSELSAQGAQVLEASAGEAALNLFETDPVDALFTDIQLGGELNGWDIAESLRAMQPDLAVIYTSGNGVDRTRQVSRALFFDKPYDCSRVAEACQELLSATDGPDR